MGWHLKRKQASQFCDLLEERSQQGSGVLENALEHCKIFEETQL